MRATNAELDELRRLGADAPALAKPLRQLLQTIDDRRRAVEPDPRAAATDPPAPDKTHISGQGGFTGMEAIWNYFYWQALSTNAFDSVGHILRLSVLVGACGNYTVTREGGEEAVRRLQPVARALPAGDKRTRSHRRRSGRLLLAATGFPPGGRGRRSRNAPGPRVR